MRNNEATELRSASLMRYLRPRCTGGNEAGKGEKRIDIQFEQQVKVITEPFIDPAIVFVVRVNGGSTTAPSTKGLDRFSPPFISGQGDEGRPVPDLDCTVEMSVLLMSPFAVISVRKLET